MNVRILLLFLLTFSSAFAQMRPIMPPMMGGIPGAAQFHAIEVQRHQARTLLYREALEELKKNPRAADLPECAAGETPKGGACLARAADTPVAAAAPRRRLALLIGNNSYAHPIPPLETPIADVTRIAGILQSRFGYETRIVSNVGKAGIIEAFNEMAAQAQPDDSVLLFYAGHGYLLEEVGMGYWIPSDGSVKTAKGWISNSDISKLLAAVRARQLILISDSCYSGTLTKEQKFTGSQELKPEDILRQRSVMVFSSGADEPVSDEGREGHSIFAWSLIRTLQAAGGLSPGAHIWSQVKGGIGKDYDQKPQYGAVVSAGHVSGGDFLFQPVK